jgi:hypothetical protein
MRSQTFRKPILKPSVYDNNDPQKAVAILLAAFSAKFQGGNQMEQDQAAIIAANLLNQGVPAINAIQWAVKRVLQTY